MKTDLDLVPPELSEFADMTPEERAFLMRAMQDASSHRAALRDLQDADFECTPVSIREFLTDPELLGRTGQITDWETDSDEQCGIYKFWREQLDDLFDPNKRYQQWTLSCAIGSGKSFISVIAILYRIYQLLCLRDPQTYCGINSNSPITFAFFSSTMAIGRATEYAMLTAIMGDSPFFKRMSGTTEKYRPHELLKLPKNIHIAFGSRAQHALGQNFFGGLADESNFGLLLQDRQQAQLFDAFWRRLQSRFADSISPGLLIMASSKAGEVDFLEQHIRRWATAENADLVKVTRAALYDVKPNQFRATDKFQVMLGNDTTPSRILAKGELPQPGFEVIEIPNHPALKAQYHADLEAALRDISSIVVSNSNPLIPLRAAIVARVDEGRRHPFQSESVFAGSMGDELEIQQLLLPDLITIRKAAGRVPRVNSSAPRYVHIDVGLRHDALGLAMCHLCGSEETEKINAMGEVENEAIPHVFVDLLLQVKCRPGDQIDLMKVVRFVRYLAQFCGYGIAGISFDQFQSAQPSQILAKLGFEVSYVSVDRNESPYLTLASLIQNECISYYPYSILQKELRELRRDIQKKKVDHPQTNSDGSMGSKDVSDALCGAVTSALKNPQSFRLPDLQPLTTRDFIAASVGAEKAGDLRWVTGTSRRVKVLNQPEFTVRDIFGNPVR
jgi:hypothetical protein